RPCAARGGLRGGPPGARPPRRHQPSSPRRGSSCASPGCADGAARSAVCASSPTSYSPRECSFDSVDSPSGTPCIMPYRRGNFKVRGSEGQVVRALGGIAGATLVSRVLGFVRDMVVARAFGAGPVTDAFFVAFRIPNILRRVLAEGALSTAMIPVFTDYVATRERPELVRMLRAVLGLALMALTVTTVLGILGAPWVVRVIAPGFTSDPAQAELAARLARIMLPALLLVRLAAMANRVLNSHDRFLAGASGSSRRLCA